MRVKLEDSCTLARLENIVEECAEVLLENYTVIPESLNSVDEAVHHVTTAIQSAAWAATPAPILPIGSQVVPVRVREKVQERRQLRRI
ncbi:hypothetical protein DMENIID0001_058760 [Sergentomyia squamirostris]